MSQIQRATFTFFDETKEEINLSPLGFSSIDEISLGRIDHPKIGDTVKIEFAQPINGVSSIFVGSFFTVEFAEASGALEGLAEYMREHMLGQVVVFKEQKVQGLGGRDDAVVYEAQGKARLVLRYSTVELARPSEKFTPVTF